MTNSGQEGHQPAAVTTAVARETSSEVQEVKAWKAEDSFDESNYLRIQWSGKKITKTPFL